MFMSIREKLSKKKKKKKKVKKKTIVYIFLSSIYYRKLETRHANKTKYIILRTFMKKNNSIKFINIIVSCKKSLARAYLF